ncbi:MAG: division/cell wall cluster transcriptional repressor MraZ [Clostridia bacterium]|nr:division/cell wall cluster transcriptional repressor MraZ [Oscillospiraceae bacterium]MBO7179341.1 division/cell wall cluster transcriptional repressor MraZ [Clostridia bacterium]
MSFGMYNHSVDSKNRFIIPAQLRSELGDRIILFRSPDESKCIYVYTEERWDEICREIDNLPPSSNSRHLQRALLHAAIPVELDKTGRVTLNQSFKEYANIVKDIVIVGVSSRIEVWAQEEWDKEAENFNECLANEIEIRF